MAYDSETEKPKRHLKTMNVFNEIHSNPSNLYQEN